jgi:uncharacterized protein (TIGR02270 family)
MGRTTAEPFWDLVEESLDEAAFLWKRWEGDLESPARGLDAVYSWVEDRLQGALDGVRVAREPVLKWLESLVENARAEQLTVCAHLLAARSAAQARNQLAAAIREANGPRLWSMIRGIEVAELDASFAPVATALSSASPEHRAALCTLKAFRRSPPGSEVSGLFDSGEPRLQVAALRALRQVKDDSAGKYVVAGMRSDNAAVRRAALECGARQRQAGAWDGIRKLVYERNPESAPFLSLLASVGSPDDAQLVIGALREPSLQRTGLFALGYVGTPEAVDICLEAMSDRKLARSAGEAYCAITGADLQRDRLAAPEPEEEGESPPVLAADSLDANLVPAAHDLWPLPDEKLVRNHWQAAQSRYRPGVRYLYGKPLNLAGLVESIEQGPMLRRPDLITELTIRSGGRYDVEPRAFAHVQRRMMVAGRGVLS